jgi:hypothetical protein
VTLRCDFIIIRTQQRRATGSARIMAHALHRRQLQAATRSTVPRQAPSTVTATRKPCPTVPSRAPLGSAIHARPGGADWGAIGALACLLALIFSANAPSTPPPLLAFVHAGLADATVRAGSTADAAPLAVAPAAAAAAPAAPSRPLTIALVGFGNFGQFLAGRFLRNNHKVDG